MRRILTAAVSAALVAGLTGATTLHTPGSPGAAPGQAAGTTSTPVPAFGHVFLIIGENTSLFEVNAKTTPYIFNTLKPQGAWLTNYNALHDGSLANYIGMTSGQFTKCDVNDDLPYNLNTMRPSCHWPGDNLFSQLDAANVSWTEWNESMPNPCDFFDTGTDWAHDVFSTHHSPAVYYDNIEGARYSENFGKAPKPECLRNVLPTGGTGPNDMSAFNSSLASGDVNQFNMVIPNDCQNGHDLCGPPGSGIFRQFDSFLTQEVPKIEASPAFGSNGLILITYDEWGPSNPPNHKVAFLALGPLVTPGVFGGGPYNHYSLLRTLEDGFRVSGRLGGAATAKPLPIFK
ncbi:MAG TPA: alkaline phosphatase family protein [Streptosporangiaceae bacterium]|nr:alkaline phosphatase family protein [Streptosporangiaceae bacterium]